MAVPPSRISFVQSSWTTTSSPKTLTVTVQAGDLVIVAGIAESSSNNFGISGGSGTWTKLASVNSTSYSAMTMWAQTVTTGGTYNLSVSQSGLYKWGASATVWRNHGGVGNYLSGTGEGDPDRELTTSADSAIEIFIGDHAAADLTSRSWHAGAGAITELAVGRSSGDYSWINAVYADTNAAATYEIGLNWPQDMSWSMLAVEIKGTSGGVTAKTVTPASIPSAVAFGTVTASYGIATVVPTSIAPNTRFGNTVARVDTWQQIIDGDSWREAITAPQRTLGYRAEMIDNEDHHVVDVPLTGGSISFDGDAAEQWACEITIPGEDWIPREPTDYLDPRAGLRIRIWYRLLINGGWVEVPTGTFVLEDPRITDNGAMPSTSLRGRDPLTIIRRAGYGSLVISVGGLTIPEALQLIMTKVAPDTPFRIDSSSTRTLPATYELTGQDPLDDMTTIAKQADLIIRTDPEGRVIAQPKPDPQTLRADWQEGPDCPVIDLARAVNTSHMLNSVTVVSTNPEVIPPISVTVEDDDPSSPTWIGGPWGRRATTIRTDSVASEAAAESMARGILNGRRRPTEEITIEVPPRGDLMFRDRVALKRTMSGVSNTYRIAGWTLPFGHALEATPSMTVKMMSRTLIA